MSKKITMSEEFKGIVIAARDIAVVHAYIDECNERYDAKKAPYVAIMADIHNKRNDMIQKDDVRFSVAQQYKKDEYEIAEKQCDIIDEMRRNELEPLIAKKIRAERAISEIEGLYIAYKLGYERMDYHATGMVTVGKKVYTVKVSFNDLLVKLCEDHKTRFNSKSAKACAESIMTCVGGNDTKDYDIKAYGKARFVRKFVACVCRYCQMTGQELMSMDACFLHDNLY